jgi:hypothetical protein
VKWCRAGTGVTTPGPCHAAFAPPTRAAQIALLRLCPRRAPAGAIAPPRRPTQRSRCLHRGAWWASSQNTPHKPATRRGAAAGVPNRPPLCQPPPAKRRCAPPLGVPDPLPSPSHPRRAAHLAGEAPDAARQVLAAQRLDVFDLKALHIQVVHAQQRDGVADLETQQEGVDKVSRLLQHVAALGRGRGLDLHLAGGQAGGRAG